MSAEAEQVVCVVHAPDGKVTTELRTTLEAFERDGVRYVPTGLAHALGVGRMRHTFVADAAAASS